MMDRVQVLLDWFPNTNHTGFYVAQMRGYFAEADLDVQISGDVHGVLRATESDLVLCPMISMLEKRDSGADLTVIATLTQKNDSGIVSLAEEGIVSPRDLEGKRLTHWAPRWFHEVVGEAMRMDGGDYSKVNLVPMDVGDIVSTLGTAADATWVYENWENQELLAAGRKINFIRLADIDPLFDFPAPCIAATGAFLLDRPDVAQRMLLALERGYVDSARDPEGTVLEIRRHLPDVSDDVLVRSQSHLAPHILDDQGRWGRISADRWNPMAGFLVEKGVTRARHSDEYSNEFLA